MRRKKIGTMNFHGSVDITDPCYDRDVWFRMTDVKIRKGVYTCIHGGINADSYELVFDGDLPAQTAEDVFRIFNLEHPNGYRGRSMSVSDIVWMEGIGYWFCDSIGFRQIKFAGEKCC